MRPFRTSELARMANIHPNTVRLYERIGFLSPVPRAANGYREYDQRHLYQLKICRHIYDHQWIGRKLRAASLNVIAAMRCWELDQALLLANTYLALIEQEQAVAEQTAALLAKWARQEPAPNAGRSYSKPEAAGLIGVTEEALRNWERNGLIRVPRRGTNAERVYGDQEINRLRVIYMLRVAGYSLAAIQKSLAQYDQGRTDAVVRALNHSTDEDDWFFAGDRWLTVLKSTAQGAREIIALIGEAKKTT